MRQRLPGCSLSGCSVAGNQPPSTEIGGQRGPEGEIPADIPAGISTPVAALRRASPVRPRWQVAGVHAPNARLIHDVRRRRGFAGPPHGGLRGANRRDGADRPARRPTLIAHGPSSSRPPRPRCSRATGRPGYRCSEDGAQTPRRRICPPRPRCLLTPSTHKSLCPPSGRALPRRASPNARVVGACVGFRVGDGALD